MYNLICSVLIFYAVALYIFNFKKGQSLDKGGVFTRFSAPMMWFRKLPRADVGWSFFVHSILHCRVVFYILGHR